MKIRTTAMLVIILTNLIIILFSVSTGIIFVQRNIDISLETDLTVMSNIADHFISGELANLKLKTHGIAKSLEAAGEARWPENLAAQNAVFPEFIGMSVLDSDKGLIASSGEMPAPAEIVNDKYIKRAFMTAGGVQAVSSTYRTSNGVVIYLAVPLPYSNDKILVVTLPGTYFSRRLSTFTIWETGHIFMSDSDGYAVANPRENWMQERFNYINAAQTDAAFTQLSNTVKRMAKGETGTGLYSVYGIPRVCSFRPVSGSEEGWSLGVVAPLPESPVKDTDKGLLIVALVSIVLNIIAAIIASNFIKKPFERIAVLKEEADAANKAKSSFLSTMSHEIRTPMNAILGVSEIQLQNESLDPSVREAISKIYTSGDLLLSIINDILDLSKIEAGKLDLIIDKYEIASMISDTTQLNMMRIGSKLIEFKVHVDENTPDLLLGDELRIKQIFNNLLSNAFKYTPEDGKVNLSISSEPGRLEVEVVLVIVVSDTGQGLTKKQISEIFDEYSQFNNKANRSTEGTGLGMSITRNLVNMMNGSISVESEPGKGSTFTVRLSQGRCGDGVVGAEIAKNLSQFRMRSRDYMEKVKISREPMPYGRILIVDDVEPNIYVAKGLMSSYELNIESANSGAEAIEKVKSGNIYDIIFMDHMMPEMDGIEATGHIRDFGYNGSIVALSANAVGDQAELFLQNGFDDFISKPIDIRQLNQMLNRLIRDKQPEEVLEKARKQKADNEAAAAEAAERAAAKANENANKTPSLLLETFVRDIGNAVTKLEVLGEKAAFEDDVLKEHTGAINELRLLLDEILAKRGELSAGFEGLKSEARVSRLANLKIEGLDIEKGIERFSGDEQIYLEVLRTYADTVHSMLETIVEVNENTLDSYRIKVHGIKGTSYDVFAEQIASEAKSLEDAAKTGNYNYIKDNNSAFIENANKVISDIMDMFLFLDAENPKPEKKRPDEEVLSALLDACNNYDMDGADEAVEELEKYQYESGEELVKWLRENIDRMYFDKIAEKLLNLDKE